MKTKPKWEKKYQSGDATRTQMLKEAGLTWEQYQKAMVSLEEFIVLIEKEKNQEVKEAVEGLRMKKEKAGWRTKTEYDDGYDDGYNQAVRELNHKIGELLGKKEK